MKFGETFRLIRKQKKISLQEIVGEEISYSALATFERGECMLSFENLTLLLKKLNLSLDEFYCLCSSEIVETEYEVFSKKASSYFYTRNLKQLVLLSEQQLENYKRTNALFYKSNAIICNIISSMLEKKSTTVSDSDKEFILDYLWNVEVWTKYELSVLNYSLPIIPIASLKNFIKEIWKSLPKDFLNDKLHSYKFNLINSIISLMIEENLYKESQLWIDKIKLRLHGSQDFFSMTYLYTLELMLIKKLNPSDELNKEFNQLKKVLKKLGAENYANHFEIEWNAIR